MNVDDMLEELEKARNFAQYLHLAADEQLVYNMVKDRGMSHEAAMTNVDFYRHHRILA